MRIQTKKFLSMTLATAMTLSLASGLGFEQRSVSAADGDSATTSTGSSADTTTGASAAPATGASAAPTADASADPTSGASAAPTADASAAPVSGASAAPASAAPTAEASAAPVADDVVYSGEAAWVAGGDGDCRIQFYNLWGGDTEVPAPFNTKATELSITFTVSNVEAALKASEKESATAVLDDDRFGVWAANDAKTNVAEIKADGTYTVSISAEEQYDLTTDHFLAIRVEDFDGLFDKNSEGKTVAKDEATAPKFSDVKATIKLDTTKPEHVDEEPVPSDNSYIDKDLWAKAGNHAYIFYQIPGSWDHRNGFDHTDTEDGYDFIKAGGAEVDADDVKVVDVLINGDGTYTASISGIDLSAGTEGFAMLGISTDIDAKAYPNVTAKDATVKIDGTAVKDGLTLPAKTDSKEKGIYQFMAVNKYADADEAVPLAPADVALPTDSIEITFTISGLSASSDTPAPAVDNGPAKGKSFTVGNFKYKVTKAATSKANGKVTLTGLSAKGKKAKALTVPTTVKKVKKFAVTKLGSKAFKGAKATKITLSKKITAIPASAFANCKKLKTLTLKAKLKSVKKNAFKGCKNKITVKGTGKKANVKKLKKSGYKKFK